MLANFQYQGVLLNRKNSRERAFCIAFAAAAAVVALVVQQNFSGSNTDGSFTMAVANSCLNP